MWFLLTLVFGSPENFVASNNHRTCVRNLYRGNLFSSVPFRSPWFLPCPCRSPGLLPCPVRSPWRLPCPCRSPWRLLYLCPYHPPWSLVPSPGQFPCPHPYLCHSRCVRFSPYLHRRSPYSDYHRPYFLVYDRKSI